MGQILNLKSTGEKNYYFKESIKTLRTNMQFCGNSLKTIVFTGLLPNEGRGEITFSVAASFDSIGKKVLMIDADIRKSVLIKRYEIKGNSNGLSQYLSGQESPDEICYATNVENFDIILTGPYSPNPAELLEDLLFRELLEKAKERYDYIIIDTPPTANLIDGAIVVNQRDRAVIVIESGTISYHLVQRVKGQSEKSGRRILGAVLNRVDKEYENRYYKRYCGGYYGKYYRNTGGGGHRGISLWTEMGNNIYEADRKQEESKP